MPTLPLPPDGAAIGGGDLPVTDASDVLAALPDAHRLPTTAPVRDAFCEVFSRGFVEYQDVAHAAAAQCDPTRATGDYLLSLALERGVVPVAGEDPEDLRGRIFAQPDIVSPLAIIELINSIIAPYTDEECQFIEPEMDGLFIHDGDPAAAWDSFIGSEPRYPDRLYEYDAAENAGEYLTNNLPGGAVVARGMPRNFHVRIPSVDASDEDFAFAIDSVDEILAIGDGSDTSGAESDGSVATSVFVGGKTSQEIYDTIVGLVQSIKGQGISWSATVDL